MNQTDISKIKTELEKMLDRRFAEIERRLDELEEKKMQAEAEHYVHCD